MNVKQMRKTYFFLLVLVSALPISSCEVPVEKNIDSKAKPQILQDSIPMRKLEKLFIVGDFDGDKKMDTLFQHNHSQRTGKEIDLAIDPFFNDLSEVSRWYYQQKSDVYIALNTGNYDTLHLGTAHGLYCLINLGDINLDGKDEIAFAVEYLDESRNNHCSVYSLIDGHWNHLKQFAIHESAFERTKDDQAPFQEIPGFLERRNGQWFYSDYSENLLNEETETPEMKPLILDKSR